jgi:hypothetical protein
MEDYMDLDIEIPPDDADGGYDGKFAGMGEVAEKFGSPRARTQRKSAHSKTLKCQECNGRPSNVKNATEKERSMSGWDSITGTTWMR